MLDRLPQLLVDSAFIW